MNKHTEAVEAKDSAPCADCFWTAVSHIANDDVPNDDDAWILARTWLYDQGAVSACPAHQHLLDGAR